jgi:5,10-methylene-tetrahydrofolate dehydrogenase/methenyl tetrahydrofolate cyclohydrolase
MCQYSTYTKEFPQSKKDEFHTIDLTDKKYLITGASSGLGKDMCKLLLQQNAKVIMVSRSIDNLSKA